MSHLHVIGDLFLAEFLPVELFTWADRRACRVISPVPDTPPRSYLSPGGSGRLAALLAPYVDDLTLSAPIPVSSVIATLIKAIKTRVDRPVITKSPTVKGDNARILRSYSQASGRWAMELLVEYPESLEVEAASKSTTSGNPGTADSPAETIIIGDFRHGYVTEQLLRGSLTLGARVILYAGHKDANDFGMLGDVREAIVICPDNLALGWTSLSNPPDRIPEDEPEHHLDLLAAMLAALTSRFARVNHFVVICQPLTARCLVFAHDPSGGSWHVYFCDSTKATTPTAGAPPGGKTAFIASFARTLLRSDQDNLTQQVIIQAVLEGIQCVRELSDQGVRVFSGRFGRAETLPDSRPPSAASRSVGSISSAKLAGPIAESDTLLGRAALHGRLPEAPQILPGYYVPKSAQEGVRGVVEAIGTYLSKVSHRRPFNVLFNAEPGSGKSFFVECLVRRLRALSVERGRGEDSHPLIEVNLSAVDSVGAFEEQLLDVYNDIRDERAAGRIPVVMLDEFDSLLHQSDSKSSRGGAMNVVLAKMLSPLWDGVFATTKKTRRLGGFVLIMLVSDQEFLERLDVGKAKDFESRIDISCNLPTPSSDEEEFESNVRVALAMLAKHFGEGVESVELAVLEAVGRATFPHRNRGIDQLFLLSKQPLEPVFRLGHLAPPSLRSNRIVENLDLDAAASKFGTAVIRCR